MTSHQLDEERIFHVAREIASTAARADYLDQICARDQALRERVEALLEVHEQEQSFLKSNRDPSPTEEMPEIKLSSGQQIGRYKLLQKIGEGGMGVVFMAEQQRPVRRKVALKVIKPGMDTKAVVARFEAERQALAMMDHANIARVLDGGATDGGRPYFVMELVKGVPITEYCDKNELSTDERLKLFTTVCQAVQHAHQKGIIHRDMKPPNVLVTLADGQPIVKVIDFGVAKATNQQLTERTLFTAYGQMIGTPQYMSPEQAEMSCLDVDTRSDIYSLGVLLYELLTGTTPLEAEQLRTAGYAEMQRIIREVEPPKPSTRLSTSGDKLTIIAKHRKVTPEKLKSQVKGDLDWIVMKALAKDRNRRYESPNAFAQDLANYLESEPVVARPPTLGYRATKYLRRNRAAIAVTGVLLLSMGIGLAGTITQWVKAEGAKQKAEALAENARRFVVEQALRQAVAGQLDAVDDTLRDYEATITGGSNDWLTTLRGAAFVHQAEYGKAIETLEPIVEVETDNGAAAGLLTWAYWQAGMWEEGTVLANKTRFVAPREQFREFDLLFQCYGLVFLDFQQTIERCDALIELQPTWGAARLFKAIASILLADEINSRAHFEEATRELNVAREIMPKPETPLLLSVRLFRVMKIVELSEDLKFAPELVEDAKREGLDVANEFHRRYPENLKGLNITAGFYDAIGETRLADEAWNRVIIRAGPNDAFWTVGRLHIDKSPIEMLQRIDNLSNDSKMILAAKAFVLTNVPGGRDEALGIYQDLIVGQPSDYMRYIAIQIPLLLGEYELAKRQCEEWLRQGPNLTRNTQSVIGEGVLIEMLAGDAPSDSERTPKTSKNQQISSEYALGMIALGQGKQQDALKHFIERQTLGGCNSTIFWTNSFVEWLRNDEHWPRGNRRVHPDSFREDHNQ